MPTYPYACTECGHQFEKYQSFHDDPLTECPACAGRLRKVWGSVGVVFKGSGFYRNDSRTPAASGAADSAASSGSDSTASDTSSSGKSSAEKSSAGTSSGTPSSGTPSSGASSSGSAGAAGSGSGAA